MMNIHIFLSTCGANNLESRKVRMIEVKARRDRRSIAICDLPARAESLSEPTSAAEQPSGGPDPHARDKDAGGSFFRRFSRAMSVATGVDLVMSRTGQAHGFAGMRGKPPLIAKMRKNKVRLVSAS
jgi:hypothetical protein